MIRACTLDKGDTIIKRRLFRRTRYLRVVDLRLDGDRVEVTLPDTVRVYRADDMVEVSGGFLSL